MRAGRRDRRIQILALSEGAADALNDAEPTWSELEPGLWASYRIERASEHMEGPQLVTEWRAFFEVLSSTFTRAITTQHRVRFGAQDFEITGVVPVGSNRTLRLEVGATFSAPPPT